MEEKRCKRCILPETFPGISFDDKGICNYCNQAKSDNTNEKTDLLGKEKLLEIIKSAKKESEYDCVVPLSGGKDSVYVLYYAVKELGLKPVAVTYSSGYQTQMALDNIQNACKTLNVPCVIDKANKKIQDKLLKDSLIISKILGSFVLTCLSCGTLIKAIPIKVAKQKKIPFILFGDSVRESVRLMKLKQKMGDANYKNVRADSFKVRITERLAKLKEVNMTPLKFVRILPRLLHYRILTTYQLLLLGLPFKLAINPKLGIKLKKDDPQMLHFYDYVDWDPVKDLSILENELSWKHPPDRKSRFDCVLNCFGSYDALRKSGVSGNGIIASNLIREGLLSREEALKAEKLCRETAEKDCGDIIKKLGIDDYDLSD